MDVIKNKIIRWVILDYGRCAVRVSIRININLRIKERKMEKFRDEEWRGGNKSCK